MEVKGKLVNSAQNAFVEERQMLDDSLIANEVIDSMQKRGERGQLCKLDLEKAYNPLIGTTYAGFAKNGVWGRVD